MNNIRARPGKKSEKSETQKSLFGRKPVLYRAKSFFKSHFSKVIFRFGNKKFQIVHLKKKCQIAEKKHNISDKEESLGEMINSTLANDSQENLNSIDPSNNFVGPAIGRASAFLPNSARSSSVQGPLQTTTSILALKATLMV